LKGIDSLYSMGNMPPGINVFTEPTDGSVNGMLGAAGIVANKHAEFRVKLAEERERRRIEVYDQNEELAKIGPEEFYKKYFQQ
jgi:5-(carboxyamino)imidazole ribonucleotide mutase